MASKEHLPCPACGLEASKNGFGIVKCSTCGHRWMANTAAEQRRTEQAVYTQDYAGYRPDPVFERTVRLVLRSQLEKLKPPPAEILDVGCGSGDFLAAASEGGYAARGIDVSEAGPAMCRSRGLDAVSGDFLTYDFGQRFDLITMWDVIEHLRDPAAFFARSREILKPGGFLFGKVPGFGDLSVGLSKRVPRLAGVLLGAPSHIQYFNRNSLRQLGSRTGFDFHWLPPVADEMRSRAIGGSIKRRVGRSAARSIRTLSGDRNLQFVARAPS